MADLNPRAIAKTLQGEGVFTHGLSPQPLEDPIFMDLAKKLLGDSSVNRKGKTGKISNVLDLPNFSEGLSNDQKTKISGGASQTGLGGDPVFGALAASLLGGNSNINRNIKKIQPNSIELFDDNSAGSPTQPTKVEAAPLKAESQTAKKPLQETPVITPDVTSQDGGGFGDFISSPGFRRLLAQLGGAVSASAPNSFANQLSQIALGGAESEIFNQMLSELLGGQQENPSVPTPQSGLEKLALLPPEMQLAALQAAEGAKSGARQRKSADVRDFANMALAVDRLRPEEKAQRAPSSRVETFKTLPDGRTAPPGMLIKMGFNDETGQFDKFQGLIPESRAGQGGDKKERLKPSELEALQENIVLAFDSEIKDGIAKKFGQDIATSGQLLQFLRSGEFGSPLDVARSALAESPNILRQFNEEIEKGALRVSEGAELSTAIRERVEAIQAERESLTKGTLPGVRTSAEVSK